MFFDTILAMTLLCILVFSRLPKSQQVTAGGAIVAYTGIFLSAAVSVTVIFLSFNLFK